MSCFVRPAKQQSLTFENLYPSNVCHLCLRSDLKQLINYQMLANKYSVNQSKESVDTALIANKDFFLSA